MMGELSTIVLCSYCQAQFQLASTMQVQLGTEMSPNIENIPGGVEDGLIAVGLPLNWPTGTELGNISYLTYLVPFMFVVMITNDVLIAAYSLSLQFLV